MIHLRRPPRPTTWEPGATAEVEALGSRVAADGSVNSSAWKDVNFNNIWRVHKPAFALVQHGKCAYCERVNTGHGDVEHILPKKEVHVLDEHGKENPATGRARGRTSIDVVWPGYWWRAWTWENYCLACEQCNQGWKKNFIDIAPPHTPVDPPREERAEQVFFVHPIDDDPHDHMEVARDGFLVGRDRKGASTIDTVGLNRPGLVELREDVFDAAVCKTRDFLDPRSNTELHDIIQYVASHWPFAAARRAGVAEALRRQGDQTPWMTVAGFVMLADAHL